LALGPPRLRAGGQARNHAVACRAGVTRRLRRSGWITLQCHRGTDRWPGFRSTRQGCGKAGLECFT
jgi:hypothetical protein